MLGNETCCLRVYSCIVLCLTACNQKKTFLLKLFLFYYWSVSFFIGQYNLEMILPWIGFDLNSFEISKISKKKEKQLLWSLNPISQSKPNPQRLNFEETNKKLTGSRECIEQFEPFQFQPERTCTSTWVNPVLKPKLLSLNHLWEVNLDEIQSYPLRMQPVFIFSHIAIFSSFFLRWNLKWALNCDWNNPQCTIKCAK